MKHTSIFFEQKKGRRFFRKLVCALLCVCLLLPLSACGETKMAQTQVYAMDAAITLTAYGKYREAGLSAAQGVINSMDAMLDPELSTSITYAINHADGANAVVSGQVAKMLSTAKLVYDRSGGALDLSLYPLIKLWGFVDGKYYVPEEEEVSAAMLQRCFDKMTLNSFPSSGSFSVSFPRGAQISFAAVAKGCAAENAVNAMRQAGVTSGIVTMNGNVQTLGLKPDDTKWTVAIQDPNITENYLGVVSVGETAVVTSGGYQCTFPDIYGNTYHHILNPNTGYPVRNTLLSATVICPDGTLADALATAMCVLGETRAINYWRSYGSDFELILVTDDGRVLCSSGLIEEITLTPNSSYTLSFFE